MAKGKHDEIVINVAEQLNLGSDENKGESENKGSLKKPLKQQKSTKQTLKQQAAIQPKEPKKQMLKQQASSKQTESERQVSVKQVLSQYESTQQSAGQQGEYQQEEQQQHRMFGKLRQLMNFAEEYRIMLVALFSVFLVVVVGMIGAFNHYMAYEYSYNGKVLGVVKDKEDVLKITDLVQTALTEEQDIEVIIDKKDDITFKRVSTMGGSTHIDTSEDVLKRMTYVNDINVKACSIMVDGKRVAVVDSKESAKEVLKSIKSDYITEDENVVVEDAKFAENIEIKEVNTDLGKLQQTEDAKQTLQTGAVVEKSHVVMAGDTLMDLANTYGTSEEELLELNPEINPEKLEVGSEIKVQEKAPVVTIETSELITYEEEIDYEVTEEPSDEIYEGERKVEKKGEKGVKVITARVEKSNGKESTKVPIVEKVEKEPVAEVVKVGTKKRPPTVGTGKYIYPVKNYRFTSGFGARWGRMHEGIDLACPMGTDVMAADGGTVTFAGYHVSYGYLVVIDHQNGMETYYGHNSELLVKEGDKVYQGYHIAESGNTGRSTGPHCHFEIKVDGTSKDPLEFLP